MVDPGDEDAARTALRVLGMLLRLPACDERIAPRTLETAPHPELADHRDFLAAVEASRTKLIQALTKRRNEEGRLTNIGIPVLFNVESWLFRQGHAEWVGRLRRVLEEVAGSTVAHTEGGKSDPLCYWYRTPDGDVEIRLGEIRRRLTGPRLVELFLIVARAGERGVEWRDVLEELIRQDSEAKSDRVRAGRPIRLVSSTRTLRRYGIRIREKLGPIGVYWEQDTRGAQWRGDELPDSG